MSYYGSMYSTPNGEDTYENHCSNGKCSNCGECCTDLLPVTKAELERIRKYAEDHHLKEHRQAPFWDANTTDLTCPFRNQQEGKCDIYPVRPYICRNFICSKSINLAHKERDQISQKTGGVTSLRYEIFGNTECVGLITSICLKVAGLK